MDPVGVISLVYDVSKDLYTWYRAVKDCDSDIKELRTQLLLLCQTSGVVAKALKREGVKAEEKSHVEDAVSKCAEAADELKSAVDKIRLDDPQPQTALAKLKKLGRKTVYPFKRKTIGGLADDVETCQDALQIAITILQLNVAAKTTEELQQLDKKLVDGVATLATALQELKLSSESAKVEIVDHLVSHRKLLTDAKEMEKAKAIVKSLEFPEMNARRQEIPDAPDASLDWMFTSRAQAYPQLADLLTFLETSSGLFWIRGKPASGKSTFMKFLLDRSHGDEVLWKWSGTKKVVFASQFCWVAGTTMQRSQQGLLQSLLHQVLSADLALVPIVCTSRWNTDAGQGAWHVKELWASIRAAVTASNDRFCFLVDGLDEIEPDTCHKALTAAIVLLSSYDNVKVIASSRPWPAFERGFCHVYRLLTMEDINRLSICGFIRGELDASAIDETFSGVNWDCIRSCECPEEHAHDDAHALIDEITGRTDGVFLWISLVMDAVCRHVALGCPLPVLRSYVDRFPGELDQYFYNLVFKRIHESLLSDTAMVLAITLLPKGSPLSFYLPLCDYTDSGQSRLTDPEFWSVMPWRTCTEVELKEMAIRAITLIRVCCGDLVNTTHCQHKLESDPIDGHVDTVYDTDITFTHRTVYDFLHTPQMQKLLAAHIPEHFGDELFELKLRIATWKLTVTDLPSSGSFSVFVWLEHANCCYSVGSHCGRRDIRSDWPSVPLDLLREAETVVLQRLKLTKVSFSPFWDTSFRILSVMFAQNGRYGFLEAVLRDSPGTLNFGTSISKALGMGHGAGIIVSKPCFDLVLLKKLLSGGANPNIRFPGKREKRETSIWGCFLGRLGCHEASSIVYSHPQVQTAIKLMIGHGADLNPDIVDSLRVRLPSDNEFDWPSFLDTYTQPAKRDELRQERRLRIQGWEEHLYDADDRLLLGMKPRA